MLDTINNGEFDGNLRQESCGFINSRCLGATDTCMPSELFRDLWDLSPLKGANQGFPGMAE